MEQSQNSEMQLNLLNIAIPTYNRSGRLSRSLDELRDLIVRSGHARSISVYVSDNGSTDNTQEVLKEQELKYIGAGIDFIYETTDTNKGFDANIQKCFLRGSGEYCWFISDDDNLNENILDQIIKDIRNNKPNLLFYNFDQAPFGKSSPLIKEIIMSNTKGTDFGFKEFIQFPKLTSMVIRRTANPIQLDVFSLEGVLTSGFAHVALAMQTAFYFGQVMLSSNFSAYPDPNHRDHIDFPPYIGNRYNKMARILFKNMGKPEWINSYMAEHIDVGVSALEWLIDYYRGRSVVPEALRGELVTGIKGYVREKGFRVLLHPKFIRRSIYLLIAWLRWLLLEKIFGVQVTKVRIENK